jgi:hypothetical protein
MVRLSDLTQDWATVQMSCPPKDLLSEPAKDPLFEESEVMT